MFSWKQFEAMPVVGIMRNIPVAAALQIAEVYAGAGMSTLEVTINSPDAFATIEMLREKLGDRLNIGAGTVCNKLELKAALHAGAQFIVTPVFDKQVIKKFRQKEIPIFCGAYTPTEIYNAWKDGADMIKVFPASTGGPAYIKDVLAPLSHIPLLPTGGVSPDNFIPFMQAGAKGVGMGSCLFPTGSNYNLPKLKTLYAQLLKKYRTFIQLDTTNKKTLEA